MKHYLIEDIESTMCWRQRVGDQYSQPHSYTAAVELQKLADHVEDLPDDHPLFTSLDEIYSSHEKAEALNSALSFYGYKWEGPGEFVISVIDQNYG